MEYMFSIYFRKQRDEKMENNSLTLIIKMYILFARTITTSTARASSVSPSSYTNTIFNQSAHMLSWDCFLRAYIEFWLIFIFCGIELIFGSPTCFDMKSIVP